MLADLLQQSEPLYLLFDTHKSETPLPEGTTPQYLFDRLEAAAAAAVSPVFLPAADAPSWPSLLDAGWSRDAIVCIYSSAAPDELLRSLRDSCHAENDSVMGLGWPRVLSAILNSFTPEVVDGLMPNVTSVLIPGPDSAESWQIISRQSLDHWLRRLGADVQTVDSATNPLT
jgi:hypothetical protein